VESDEERAELMEAFMEGVGKMMKGEVLPQDQMDVHHILRFYQIWRQFLNSQPHLLVHAPPLDPSSSEDDVFVFQGLLSPGVHNLTIYFPPTDQFFLVPNLVVFPNSPEIDHDSATQLHFSKHKPEQSELGANQFKTLVAQLFQDLVSDYHDHRAARAFGFDCDSDSKLKALVVDSHLGDHYSLVMKLWTCLAAISP
jgi:hypothetical protein